MSVINHKDKSGKTPLIRACCSRNVDMVTSLLAHKDIDVNVSDVDGDTALHYSTMMGLPDITELLLQSGATVNYLDGTGSTPLNYACLTFQRMSKEVDGFTVENFLKGIQLLLKNGADPNLPSTNGWAPLHNACGYSQIDTLVNILIEAGADMDAQETIGITPLMVACQMGFAPAVQALVNRKINVDVRGENQETAFWKACQNDHCDCAAILIAAHCDINAHCVDKTTALWIAAYNNNCDIINLLIKNKANLNLVDGKGHTAVWAASRKGRAQALELLINAGADIKKSGKTAPLWIACQNGHLPCVKLLLKSGADIEKPIANGTRPLNIACETNNPEIVEFLIQNKADLNARNDHEISATSIASFKGHVECLKLMVEAGADLSGIDKDGHTPLHLAVYNNHPKCVEILLKAGADYKCQDKNGQTPLHLAVNKDHPQCVKMLISCGADQTITDKAGAAPLHIATRKNHTLCAKLLLGENVDIPTAVSTSEKETCKPAELNLEIMKELDTLLEKLVGTRRRSELSGSKPKVPQALEQIAIVKEDESKAIHVMDVATSFLKDLDLSGAYFDPNYNVCFCEPCHTKRGDKLKYTRGNPPMDYGLPIGWCKFGLKLKPQAEAENIFSDWHVAFHGTRVQNLKKILKNGDLLKPGDVTYDGEELAIPPNHWDPKNPAMKPPPGHDVRKLYFSPSIKYSGCSCYAPVWGWMDPKTNTTHHIRVAFQVRIKPGVYKITPQTIGAKKELDPLFPNKELEWSTNRFGVSMLVGLLVKIEGHTSEKKVDIARAAAKHEPTLPQASFDESRPVQILHEYMYKTPRGGHKIKLRPGDDCLLLSKSDKECVIMHPKVDDPISLPISHIRL